MALAKNSEEVNPVEKAESSEEVKKTPKKRVKMVRVVGKKFSFHHPFQNQNIPMIGGDGVKLELDSWLESQIEAGHIIKV